MPDDYAMPGSISLAMPSEMLDAYDKLAAALERPREWVMLRALRQYLEDGEGSGNCRRHRESGGAGPGGIRHLSRRRFKK